MEQSKQTQNSDWGFFPIAPIPHNPIEYLDSISYDERNDQHDSFRTETFTPERFTELEEDPNIHNMRINTRDNVQSPDMKWEIQSLLVIELATLPASLFGHILSSVSGRQEPELHTSQLIQEVCISTPKLNHEQFSHYKIRCINPDYHGEPEAPNPKMRYMFIEDDIFYFFFKLELGEDGQKIYQCKNFLSQETVEFDSIPQTKPFLLTKTVSKDITLPSLSLIYDKKFKAPIEEYSFCYILRSRHKYLVVNNNIIVQQRKLRPLMNPNLFHPIKVNMESANQKKRERAEEETPPSITQVDSIFESQLQPARLQDEEPPVHR